MKPYWLELAEKEIGVTETPGLDTTKRIAEYFDALGVPHEYTDEDNWCSVTMLAVMKAAHFDCTGVNEAAISWLKFGRPLKGPRKGAICVLWRDDPASWKSHVGIVDDWDDTRVKLIGGNQSDKVGYGWYPRYRVRKDGYRWPPVAENLTAIKRRTREQKAEIIGKMAVPVHMVKVKAAWYAEVNWKSLLVNTGLILSGIMQLHPATMPVGRGLFGLLTATKLAGKKDKKNGGKIADFIGWIIELLKKWFSKK